MAAAPFGSAHWGRVFYKVEQIGSMASTDTGAVAHSTFVSFSDDDSEFRVLDTVMNQSLDHQFLYNIQPSGDSEWGCGSSYDFNYGGDWQCAEWQLASDSQSYRFFFEGVEVGALALSGGTTERCGTANRDIPADLGNMNVGIYTYQSMATGFVVIFDDLAIGSERVGCD